MNPLIEAFKECAHMAGEICGFPTGRLIRDFGLEDFLENAVQETDDAATIAVRALGYFCEDPDTQAPVFKFAVLTIGVFLSEKHAKRGRKVPRQPLKDLVDLLTMKASESQIRQWIASHF
jgi:hypothetical protein